MEQESIGGFDSAATGQQQVANNGEGMQTPIKNQKGNSQSRNS